MKRTTKEQKADALLKAASKWQFSNAAGEYAISLISGTELQDDWWNTPWQPGWDLLASWALSEVAGMGYDLLNADGTECEKTHEVETVALRVTTRDDGTQYFTDKLRPVRR